MVPVLSPANGLKARINAYDIASRLLEGTDRVLDRELADEAIDRDIEFDYLDKNEQSNIKKREIIYGRSVAREILAEIKEIGSGATQEKIKLGIVILYRDSPDRIDELEMIASGRGYLSKLKEEFM
jgi:hypothetical protein